MRVCLKLSKFSSFKLMVLIQIAILFHKNSNALYETKPKGIFNELLLDYSQSHFRIQIHIKPLFLYL
jgi:hypothetical protein